jgi:hypothetical protein
MLVEEFGSGEKLVAAVESLELSIKTNVEVPEVVCEGGDAEEPLTADPDEDAIEDDGSEEELSTVEVETEAVLDKDDERESGAIATEEDIDVEDKLVDETNERDGLAEDPDSVIADCVVVKVDASDVDDVLEMLIPTAEKDVPVLVAVSVAESITDPVETAEG